LCNSQDGKLVKEFGTIEIGSSNGQFYYPFGLTVDNKYVYICDSFNNRVQILIKENGEFVSKWGKGEASLELGQFSCPNSIYHHLSENLIYVGDNYSVQLFRKDGVCIQRLGEKEFEKRMNQFCGVSGICVMDDRLYIDDCDNKRIQIYSHKQESLQLKEHPIITAASTGETEIVKNLLDSKVSVDQRGENGRTSLTISASKGYYDTVKLLLERQANVNSHNRVGNSAIILAACNGHSQIVDLLLQHNGNPFYRGQYSMRAIDWALSKNHDHMATVLSSKIIVCKKCGRRAEFKNMDAEKCHSGQPIEHMGFDDPANGSTTWSCCGASYGEKGCTDEHEL